MAEIAEGSRGARTAIAHPTPRLLGAVSYLLFDIAALWATFTALGTAPPVAAVALAYLIGYLANSLPIPGGIGVLDAGLAGALVLYGLPATHAAAAVLVYHAITIWIPGLGGLVAYARLRRSLECDWTRARARTRRKSSAAHRHLNADPSFAGGVRRSGSGRRPLRPRVAQRVQPKRGDARAHPGRSAPLSMCASCGAACHHAARPMRRTRGESSRVRWRRWLLGLHLA